MVTCKARSHRHAGKREWAEETRDGGGGKRAHARAGVSDRESSLCAFNAEPSAGRHSDCQQRIVRALPTRFFRPAGSGRVDLRGRDDWVLCVCRRSWRGDDSAVETQADKLACALGTAPRRAGRGGLLCRSRFTLGAGTPSTASAPRIPASATSPAGWRP
uniref:Uncharacterized protein n=1 Tax=Rangifer tarandus platyrhynchus TaxID=3082113 RepID=A0ACB0DY53_RANTA|nr:unnamed protein product [Rangifer tarandus platyrhynchus]